MEDENSTVAVEKTVPAETPPKQAKKVVSELGAETPASSGKVGPKGNKSTGKPESSTPTDVKSKVKSSAKNLEKTRVSKPTAPAPAPTLAIDDVADLLELEKENERLRKSLSEKLRAENADLRKRLGLA
ncbi:SyrB-like regulator [Ensifer adhaerens]|uniref:SyrB-like regulator n=1 Tax=Ensifer adhaerens TaxID=106592 RepID=UPI001CBEAC7B|nr:SyrB-like regulator [Ensifer adhaerens]MBZ7927717.1 SyrB-like regulator [Ensifer adhaerens]UAX96639.1 SyrB-like regulator [Ensifer adhaerens]UAY04017.1 SyrB-like regulator [Ensifer adhaerens]UAY12003.1 SyrB-like regulator [Ensifer adhaerens]